MSVFDMGFLCYIMIETHYPLHTLSDLLHIYIFSEPRGMGKLRYEHPRNSH
jgi:hypothetical protein